MNYQAQLQAQSRKEEGSFDGLGFASNLGSSLRGSKPVSIPMFCRIVIYWYIIHLDYIKYK